MTVESEYAYFKDREDWDHYCAKIDNRGAMFRNPWDKTDPKPYPYFHDPEPQEYPCLGKVEFEDDPNGPYCMFYEYVYLVDAARLLHASVADLQDSRDAYRNAAIELFMLFAETDLETAEKAIDKKVFRGR